MYSGTCCLPIHVVCRVVGHCLRAFYVMLCYVLCSGSFYQDGKFFTSRRVPVERYNQAKTLWEHTGKSPEMGLPFLAARKLGRTSVVMLCVTRLIRRTLALVLARPRSPWRPPRPLRGPPLLLSYHKGGTDVGVCPVSTTYSTLKSDHALTTTRKQAKSRIFFVAIAPTRQK